MNQPIEKLPPYADIIRDLLASTNGPVPSDSLADQILVLPFPAFATDFLSDSQCMPSPGELILILIFFAVTAGWHFITLL